MLPSSVAGWKTFERDGAVIKGNFVLREGEEVNDGKVTIKLLHIDDGCRLLSEPEPPRAKLQFSRVTDGTVLCTQAFNTGQSGLGRPTLCASQVEWGYISLNINTKDKWIVLELLEFADN